MAKAELSYNPYLPERKIKFNGKEPRINSPVEKYRKEILWDWIKEIPAIFHDEMNGFDFDLEFSGTKAEYEALVEAFLKANVSEDMVRLFHTKQLEDRRTKYDRIDELIQWLYKNPNSKFDAVQFMKDNAAVFAKAFSCILLHGTIKEQEAFGDYHVTLKNTEDIWELETIDLYHTPIVINLREDTLFKIKDNLRYFLERKDVGQNQLFFWISPSLNGTGVEDTLFSLGIDNSQIISEIEDEKIRDYLEVYPISDYIISAIKLLGAGQALVSSLLEKEEEEAARCNKDIYRQIEQLQRGISRLKESMELFNNKDNHRALFQMRNIKARLLSDIQNWKSKKIKITKESEANYLTQEFQSQVKVFYSEFCDRVRETFERIRDELEEDLKCRYGMAGIEPDFRPDLSRVQCFEAKALPEFARMLLGMKEEKYVAAKDDLLGKIFRTSNDREVVALLEVSFYCQQWRDYALTLVEPLANEVLRENEKILKNYGEELARLYRIQLRILLHEQSERKEEVSQGLYKEELKLTEDKDWLVKFAEHLRRIEVQ